jgi:GNAT superfamily N-acetyltransferase
VAEEPPFSIRPGRPDEGERLKEIAIAAKGFWGYEPAKVREWADRGDFTYERLAELTVFVAESDGRPIGWSSLVEPGERAWHEDLWVEPAWIGRGVGSALFRHSAAHAERLGAGGLEWEAEPNALGFYEKLGARILRDSASEWGRTLSVMGIDFDG